MDKFDYCDDCIYLSLSEAEQNKTRPKIPHRCTFYDKRAIHRSRKSLAFHSVIFRLYDCIVEGTKKTLEQRIEEQRRHNKTNTELRIG